ncbi:beta strand repeat-containing protein [Adhaeretor mobilis]|uniref:Autotransporter-associated beta strand repeat protein n=1 Tax=Adhaeretor mobilis TaxID=1930276 RepID=A0A517MYG4_9BACT|nr:hypothetical protein [Adhaeretor mobilis]QDS99893.1 hypothetical protein HG15A2_32240 [Adhaeretor mobilis]
MVFLRFVLLALLISLPSVAAAQVTALWTGSGDGSSYNDPANWDINLVPINGLNGADTYEVVIPGSQSVLFDVPGTGHQVFQLSVGSSSDFQVNSGRDIEVQDEASILGRVIADGGTFSAPSNASIFPGSAARATVLDSGQLTLAATSYWATGLASNQTLFLADGSGSLLDLSSLESINAGWDDGSGATRVNTIEASNGATIDLSSVASIESPDRGEDRLDIVVGVDSQINLAGLTTLVSDSSGDTRFVINRPDYALPSLEDARHTQFLPAAGTTLNLSALMNHNSGSYTIPDGAVVNAPQLESMVSVTMTINQGGTFSAPNLTDISGSVVEVTPTTTFESGELTNINNARLRVREGATFGVSTGDIAATSYSATGLPSTQTLFLADGSGSLLDLSSLESINAGWDDGSGATRVNTIEASNGATIDLSSVASIESPDRGEDRLDIVVGVDSQINLAGLTTLVSDSSGDTRFVINRPDYALPSLEDARHTQFLPAAGTTLNLSALMNHNSGSYTIPDGAVVNAPQLESMVSVTMTINQGGTFSAPNLTDISGSVVEVTPTTTFESGELTNINNARLRVREGATFGVSTGDIAATSYSATGLPSTQTLFLADGAGSLLDLSSLESINAGWDDGSGATRVNTIEASNGATIDLSSVASIESPDRGEDRLDIVVGVDSQINLAGLTTLVSDSSGDTRFVINRPDYALPSLEDARHTQFLPAAGTTLNLSALMNHNSGSYTIPDGAVVNAPQLESMVSVTMTINQGGTFSAPNLTDISGSVVEVTPTSTFESGELTNINNARLRVREGATFGVSTGDIAATSYSATGLPSTQTLFLADGAGSLLDLSSLESINAGWDDGSGATRVNTIEASNGSTIDLSSVASINGPSRGEDRIDFRAEGASTIDLSSLTTVTNRSAGQTRLIVGGGSTIRVGSLVSSDNLRVILSDLDSTLDVGGSLTLDSGTLSVGLGAKVQVGNNFSHSYTTESNFVVDEGIIQFNGSGAQQFEVASLDSGANAFNSGNFGIGQLVIGTTTQRTSVELIDVVDNGNQGGAGEPEALYLYGLGGPAGLRIFNNSALILNGLNVYSHDPLSGDQVHLNSLFGPGELRIAYDDGFLQLVPLDFQWGNNAGGDFNLAGNWSDGLVPLGSDAAIWNLGSVNGYDAQFGTNVATDSAIVNSDNVTYQLGGFTYSLAGINATTGLVVGQNPTDNAKLTIANGTLATRDGRVAAAGGSQGLLTVATGGLLQVDESLLVGGGQGTLQVDLGGSVQVGDVLTLTNSGRLAGSGNVIATVDNQAGAISPGSAAGPSAGLLSVTGSVLQGTSATLEIELGGVDNSNLAIPEFDTLQVDGSLILDGELSVSLVDLGGGEFTPSDGDMFTIATVTSGISGEFNSFALPEIAGLTWLLGNNDQDLVLALTDSPADFAGDSEIDGADFLAWQIGFGINSGANPSDGDSDSDGDVDPDDLANWHAQYGFEVIANTPSVGAVPEPSGLVLLGTLLVVQATSVRRRVLS